MQDSTEAFLGMPDGIWIDYIFSHFSQQELIIAALWCKKAYSLVRSPKLWKELVVYENPHDTFTGSRSITHFDMLTRKFFKLESINICLRKRWSPSIRNIPPDRYSDWIMALRRSLLTSGDGHRSILKKLQLDFNHHGSVITREDCERFFSELQEYSSQFPGLIQDVTLKEICHHQSHIHVRWWNWMDDFLLVAPDFWSHVEKLDIDDSTVHVSRTGQSGPILMDEQSFGRMVEYCPRLKMVAITTWSSCKQKQINRMLKVIEGSNIARFHIKATWITRGYIKFRPLSSHNIDVKYVFEEDRIDMSVIKK